VVAPHEHVKVVDDHPHDDPFVEVAQRAAADEGQAEPWERRLPLGLAVEVEEKAECCERSPDQEGQAHPCGKVGEESKRRPRILEVGEVEESGDHQDHQPLWEAGLDDQFHPPIDSSDSQD
jgi:hypothetical protein